MATPLDLAAARVFYHPGEENPWASVHRFPWSVLYGAAPWITASLVVIGLGMLAAGVAGGRTALRRHGIFLLLSVVIGPGLIVNFLLKDHWGRPRPREIVEFAGTSRYVSPLVPSSEGGSSFPCGHCSVGFLYGAGWWIWRYRRPGWAWASLVVGLIAGFSQGLGRMAAGGHFLSDVIWSGLLALGIAHLLHDYVLRIPTQVDNDDRVSPTPARSFRSSRMLSALAMLGGVTVLIALFGTPHGTSLAEHIPLDSLSRSRWVFEFRARCAHVDLVLEDAGPGIAIEGELHGFGLPMSTLATKTELLDLAVPTVRYSIIQRGWFTDLGGSARIRLPVDDLGRVTVRVDRGNIRVTDRTRTGVTLVGRPVFDLHTGYGHVIRMARQE